MLLTIYLKNKKKQIVNSGEAILLDDKGRRLPFPQLKEKVDTIARSIAGRNYLNHKFATD